MPGPRHLLAHTASHLAPDPHPTTSRTSLPTTDGAAFGAAAGNGAASSAGTRRGDDAAAFFRENGFVKLESYFSPAESARMVAPVADAHDGPLSPVVSEPGPPSWLTFCCAGL